MCALWGLDLRDCPQEHRQPEQEEFILIKYQEMAAHSHHSDGKNIGKDDQEEDIVVVVSGEKMNSALPQISLIIYLNVD